MKYKQHIKEKFPQLNIGLKKMSKDKRITFALLIKFEF